MPHDTQLIVGASLVSFAGLFARDDIHEIDIPMIQRDYAQGRSNGSVKRIRDNFLATLFSALLPDGRPVDLDFVFGDVNADGRFCPLDGQQRLTTLFLLHCYLSWRTHTDGAAQSWARFSYATRPGARAFCTFLTAARPALDGILSEWIRDQADYLPTWELDPTIQSMLTMLDAIHLKTAELGMHAFDLAFARLLDPVDPAIRFHVLPVLDNGLGDKLYIKMNSRGKPLTAFENFKAQFEVVLRTAGHAQANEFSARVDTVWSDVLWDYRGSDDLIDDEFLRLFRCLTEISAWKSRCEFQSAMHDDDLASMVYGASQPHAADNVCFLFDAFDIWIGRDIRAEFESLFSLPGENNHHAIPLFNAFDEEGVDLFAACCRHYGTPKWTLAHTLMFYGVLVHLRESAAAPQRLRLLRNLIDASGDEIRTGERNSMPKLLAETESMLREGTLDAVFTFNQAQIANEIAKASMLATAPELENTMHALEDHALLRGGLTAFDLAPADFAARADAFTVLFRHDGNGAQPYLGITGALLAHGDYGRIFPRESGHVTCDLGSPKNDDPWRNLLRRRKRESVERVAIPLRGLLDAVARGHTLDDISAMYLANTTQKDWRYYFVKYDVMRSGASGRYTLSPDGGYMACMLDKVYMTSLYYDPYLLAIVKESGISAERISSHHWPRAFTGLETLPREITLSKSRIGLRCAASGWVIRFPEDLHEDTLGPSILADWGLERDGPEWQLYVPQQAGVDTLDRIEAGSALLQKLVAAGM
jgi:hypothetical protein